MRQLFLSQSFLFILSSNLFESHLPIINQMLHIIELLEYIQIVLMQSHVTLQATFLHERLLANLALIPRIVFVYFHMLLQRSRSGKRLTAYIATRHFTTGVPYQMVGETALRKKPRVTEIANETPLLQMMMSDVPVQFVFFLVHFIASVARMDDGNRVMSLHKMLVPFVVAGEH